MGKPFLFQDFGAADGPALPRLPIYPVFPSAPPQAALASHGQKKRKGAGREINVGQWSSPCPAYQLQALVFLFVIKKWFFVLFFSWLI